MQTVTDSCWFFRDFLKGDFTIYLRNINVFKKTLIVGKVILISNQTPDCFNKRPYLRFLFLVEIQETLLVSPKQMVTECLHWPSLFLEQPLMHPISRKQMLLLSCFLLSFSRPNFQPSVSLQAFLCGCFFLHSWSLQALQLENSRFLNRVFWLFFELSIDVDYT